MDIKAGRKTAIKLGGPGRGTSGPISFYESRAAKV